ncbi:MAG TPA: RsmE family RNA methyltransferase [Acidimicrobiales bacterium]|nr:RsmE family RNA methyltransferase [Acidimicrobiales bacterium]
MANGGPAYAAITVRAAAAAQVFVDDPARPLLADEDAHHLGRVLRLRPGEEVVAADGRGRWARATWQGGAELAPVRDAPGIGGDGAVQSEPAAAPALTVAFAPVKGERPEWVVQKLTELGIDRIVPLVSERSVVRWSGARGKATVERLRRVAREAAAQCRRVRLPEIADTVRFAELGSLGAPGQVVLAQLSGDRPTVRQRVVAVGPEGGWSTDELASGLPTVGFGLSVLRAETAAVTAGALMASLRTGTVAAADAAEAADAADAAEAAEAADAAEGQP